MRGQEKRRGRGTPAFVLDVLHIVAGLLIVVLAVLAFLSPEDNMILFPVIFLLAAILNLFNGYDRFCAGRGEKKKRMAGVALMVVGVGLLLLSGISAATIWWG